MSDLAHPLMAVFGGTFDPFHGGHARLCELVLSYPEVAQLRLVPCQVPVLKQAAQATSEQRLAMLQRWADSGPGRDRLIIDSQELERSGPSYTLDTLRQLRRQFPHWQIVFVLGADAFAGMDHWHGMDQLIRETHFWVFGRGSQTVVAPKLPITQVDSLAQLGLQRSGLWVEGPSSGRDWASRDLRDDDRQWQAALPEPVQEYIQQHGLYRHGHKSLRDSQL